MNPIQIVMTGLKSGLRKPSSAIATIAIAVAVCAVVEMMRRRKPFKLAEAAV